MYIKAQKVGSILFYKQNDVLNSGYLLLKETFLDSPKFCSICTIHVETGGKDLQPSGVRTKPKTEI